MKILVIGGNRFVGRSLVFRLCFAGHDVTVLNRGSLQDPFGDHVERLRVDRSTDAFDHALWRRTFDGVVDLAGFTGDEMRRAVRVLGGRVGHYVFISTGQVYLVREGISLPAREADYHGPVMAAPPTIADHDDWAYGIGKRDAEDVLAAATELPSTRMRIPMVNGEGDPRRRFDAYLWRMLDRKPLWLPQARAVARHVYRGAVVGAICRVLDDPPPGNDAFNVAQAEQPTVRELIDKLAVRAGARPEIVECSPEHLEAAGLSVRAASPFSSRWMSRIDPARGVAELGLGHPPLDTYLDSIIADLFASWPAHPPPGYEQRRAELDLIDTNA